MDADGRPDARIGSGEGPGGFAALQVVADVQEACHPGGGGPGQHVGDLAGKLVAVQVQVGVEQHSAPPCARLPAQFCRWELRRRGGRRRGEGRS